jgi:hypothetical protein
LVTIKFNSEDNKANDEILQIKLATPNVESGFYLKMDKEDPSLECKDDAQRVF